ncbi:hypothetical protein AMJ87_08725 [candidate division WOR_3 bacterium SM23_60]|uniref:Pyrrolo-quinoline quinone repeat domain-containing protein n=1 Tax=candidate division WOR_3 bacterium SM23_60 TaxID=1703780 RepID=A0A0S8GF91_UNCW3|nr:MAG: hypothetical protein AMJ87_08725 [candidate division WOR_3 bacterium SM23_60]
MKYVTYICTAALLCLSIQLAEAQQEGLSIHLAETNNTLRAESIQLTSGRTGWKLQIPGNRPLATVAYEEGLIFVGGGFGSYEFYAIDAKTGNVKWIYKTGDDGPTAAVVKRGYVVFNTESCIIYVLKAATGEKVWEKWLGDPLMSQPAVDDHNVYMVYPGSDGSHHLACMRLESGDDLWDTKIAGDVVSAPILDNGSVYLTCFDGTVYRYNAAHGDLIWSQKKNATCAPTIYDNRIFVSLREERSVGSDSVTQYEGLVTLDNTTGKQEQRDLWAQRHAPYLVYGRASAKTEQSASLDASVGFGSAPGAAKLDQAKENVGQYSVAGCWAYQGSRSIVKNGYSYNAMGDKIQGIDIKTGKEKWSYTYAVDEEGIGGRVLTPPAYANSKLFLGSGTGNVLCIDEKNGSVLWQEEIDGSVSFQPAVAHGMVFVSCDNGLLYGIHTGDKNDDGWYMWGGNSGHNK